ncbi:MAG: hypothetical protein HQL51_01280 [Magnetococcales bacterium]|nr:hypothetical protein [Magnetococcales bacterium]
MILPQTNHDGYEYHLCLTLRLMTSQANQPADWQGNTLWLAHIYFFLESIQER